MTTQLEVLHPVAEIATQKAELAPRLSSLEGKRLALWWNKHGGGDTALEQVAECLTNKFKGMTFERFSCDLKGPPEALEKVVKECDAVVGTTSD